MKHWISSLLLTGIFLLCAGCAGPAAPGQEEPASLQFFAMDTVMSITAYGEQGQTGVQAARDAVNRLDGLLSRTDPDSQISQLNAHAGHGGGGGARRGGAARLRPVGVPAAARRL